MFANTPIYHMSEIIDQKTKTESRSTGQTISVITALITGLAYSMVAPT
jgi:hypothetical protein